MLWVEFLFQIVIVTIDGQLQFGWLCGPLSHRKNIRSNSSWLINNLLYQEKKDNKRSREKKATWKCLTNLQK